MNWFSPGRGQRRLYIVGYSGPVRAHFSTEQCERIAQMAAEGAGAATLLLQGPEFELPMYDYGRTDSTALTDPLFHWVKAR